MVNPSIVGIPAILIFIILIILLFTATGHVSNHRYVIFIILLLGLMLLSGFFVLAFSGKWWPYRSGGDPESDRRFNNTILFISLGVLILSTIFFFILLFITLKDDKDKIKSDVTLHEIQSAQSEEKIKPDDLVKDSDSEIPSDDIGSNGLDTEEFERLALEHELEETGLGGEGIKEKGEGIEEIKRREKDIEGTERREESIEETEIEGIKRLVLEQELEREQEQGGTRLEPETAKKIFMKEEILELELEKGTISQKILKEGEEAAMLKNIEAERALKTPLPSWTMFGQKYNK